LIGGIVEKRGLVPEVFTSSIFQLNAYYRRKWTGKLVQVEKSETSVIIIIVIIMVRPLVVSINI